MNWLNFEINMSKVKIVAKPNALFHQGKPINSLLSKTIQFGCASVIAPGLICKELVFLKLNKKKLANVHTYSRKMASGENVLIKQIQVTTINVSSIYMLMAAVRCCFFCWLFWPSEMTNNYNYNNYN